MSKKLPKVFKNNNINTTNNKKICYLSDKDNNLNNYRNKDSFSVEDKIKKLFKSSRYIFNINVLIKTNKKDYDTKIAGKVKNSLVTVDNDIIPIVEIEDIIIKDQI